MADNTLFGYTVEGHADRLVVTLHGQLAAQALARLRKAMESGSSLQMEPILGPVMSLGHLLSSAVPIASERVELNAAAPPSPVLDEVNQTFAAFKSQLDDFRKLIERDKAAAPAPKKG